VRVELLADARTELRSATLWYEERQEGLGNQFLAEVASALDRIREAPIRIPPGQVWQTDLSPSAD